MLEKLEKKILDFYLSKGYEISVGSWAFHVKIESEWKNKKLEVVFREDGKSEIVFTTSNETVKDMFVESMYFFNGVKQ